jgi:urease accessory protein
MPLSAPRSAPVGFAAARPLSAPRSAPVGFAAARPLSPGLLLLADSRLPAGGHAHSGGLEAAAAAGSVTGLDGLDGFLRGRLATAGLVSAALAAAACQHATQVAAGERPRWPRLLAEAAARTPSPAQRRASCAQGRALLRAARAAWPGPVIDSLTAAAAPEGTYHPVALGACACAAGGGPADAAVIAATASATGPAAAAVRLLGLDPLAVHGLLARLAETMAAVARSAAEAAATGDWSALPAASSPGLDLLAERHAREEVALFAS